MRLQRLLSEHRPAIVKRWLQLILETYPADSQRFLKKQKDQFANPVRHTFSEEIANLYGELLQGMDAGRISAILDRIVSIRAVQNFSPSQAISFVFLLKKVIRDELGEKIRENQLPGELPIFESRIDQMALLAFDIYMGRREKIYQLMAGESKRQVSRLLEKAGLTYDIPKRAPNNQKDNVA